MATKIEAASLINTVRYRTDRTSLKRVRAEMKALQQAFSKTHNTIAKTRQKADKQAADASLREGNRAIAAQAKASQKALQDDLKAKKKAEQAKQKAATQALKLQAEQQKKLDTVAENAMLARRKSQFQLGRIQGLSGAERYASIRHASDLVKQYEAGAISLKNLNGQLSQHLAIQKSIARNNSKQAKHSSGNRSNTSRRGSSNWVSGNVSALLPAGLIGPAAGAYLASQAYQASAQALSGAVERQRGRQQIAAQGGNNLEYQAVALESLKRTGFSLSAEKYADISKDVNEKIGELSVGTFKKDKTTGKETFSGGGELTDWVNIMTQRGGYSARDAVATLQSKKTPVELAVFLQSLKNGAKITDQEMTFLSENINDFSYITKSINEGGENVVATMKSLVNSGLSLSNTEQQRISELGQIAAAWTQISDAGEDRFAVGFSEALRDAKINSESLSAGLADLQPVMKGLGRAAGEMTSALVDAGGAIAKFVSWISEKLGTQQDLNSSGWYYNDSPLGRAVNWFKGDTSAFTPNSIYNDFAANNLKSSPAMSYQPAVPELKSDININVTADSAAFENAFRSTAEQHIQWAFDDQTFQISQSISGN
ncbi:hypothetical protein [Pseudescherichia vulneris]|uniref:hypothetical protein n=1 Tax=Pseudescherichia vulneris TaxID=566 RepID=UPI001EDE94BB|nr:hypothetical protein [Pseudescherichia vulneris]